LLIRKIFLAEGMLISLVSACAGLIIGFLLLFLQSRFGLISLGGGSGSFIIDAYPVKMLALDFLYVFLTVIIIGFLATWYPVRFLTGKYKSNYLK
jgi:lipoprotein-releasing system permease protein